MTRDLRVQSWIEENDIIFKTSGKGLSYGSFYNDNNDTTVTISDNNPTEITAGFTGGATNNTTFQSGHNLLITYAGDYKIDWSLSFKTVSGTNQEIEGGVMIDGVKDSCATAHRKIGTGTDVGNMGASCVITLSANEEVSLYVQNNNDTQNIVINHGNLALVQVGG
jgi:hypothetical protein